MDLLFSGPNPDLIFLHLIQFDWIIAYIKYKRTGTFKIPILATGKLAASSEGIMAFKGSQL